MLESTKSLINYDIEVFKIKFQEKLPNGKWLGSNINFDRVFNHMSDKLNIYDAYSVDMDGRYSSNIGYVKAFSREHANLLASIQFSNIEIFLTGFYDSKKVDFDKIGRRISILEKELTQLKSVFNL